MYGDNDVWLLSVSFLLKCVSKIKKPLLVSLAKLCRANNKLCFLKYRSLGICVVTM